MLNEAGGVIDDLITYYLATDHYRLIVNAATREKDLAWLNDRSEGFDVAVTERPELAMIAVQGPEARQVVVDVLQWPRLLELKPFSAGQQDQIFVARTGYTGEDGFEVVLPGEDAEKFWSDLVDGGVQPCGLGARDTLRLEAGLNLYGNDMDEAVTPFECGLAWTVALEGRDFIGAEALRRQKAAGIASQQIGVLLQGRGVMRSGQRVITAGEDGVVTSGTFGPTLKRSIGLARIPAEADRIEVEIRGKALPAAVVKPPFVRHGKIRIEL